MTNLSLSNRELFNKKFIINSISTDLVEESSDGTIKSRFLLHKNRYSAGKTVINDLECQMKVICEIYRDETNELGEIGKRAKHSLDFVDTVQYLNLPDEFMNLADEYVVRVIKRQDKQIITYV